MTEGVSANRAALDIVGRIAKTGPMKGRRVGGVIGLDANQIEYADNAFAQLRSGDPAQMRAYLTRQLRNRNLDPIVGQAIRDGKPVSVEAASKITNAYRQRLLAERGERIARTELKQAMGHAQDEGINQLYDSGKIQPEQVTRTWDAAEDAATRPTHAAADGQVRTGQQPFTVGGYPMKYPGDASGGAPASEIIRCRCVQHVSFDFAPVKR